MSAGPADGGPARPSHLLVDRPEQEIALITLNRPDRLNALTDELADDLRAALERLDSDPARRVVVLTGAGRGFCAGLDLVGANHDEQAGPVSRTLGMAQFSGLVRTLRAIRPVAIAAVNGPAAGAGFCIALACDIRVASRSARFHPDAIKIGLGSGECGASYFLPLAGRRRASAEILLTGRSDRASHACLEDDVVVDAPLATAREITANSPFGVWMTKRVLRANVDLPFETRLEPEDRTQTLSGLTADSAEAMAAFVERRSPRFSSW